MRSTSKVFLAINLLVLGLAVSGGSVLTAQTGPDRKDCCKESVEGAKFCCWGCCSGSSSCSKDAECNAEV